MPGFKSPLGWDFSAFRSFVYNCEDSNSLLYKVQPSLQVPSGLVNEQHDVKATNSPGRGCCYPLTKQSRAVVEQCNTFIVHASADV